MLIKSLADLKFFRDRKKYLNNNDLREMSISMKIKEAKAGDAVMTYGQRFGDFCIIIKGVCSVKSPN